MLLLVMVGVWKWGGLDDKAVGSTTFAPLSENFTGPGRMPNALTLWLE